VQGKAVVTIEGLAGKAIGDALFAAWDQIDVSQCGFCQPAQLMSASVLLGQNPNPTDADIDEAMQHNLCRCATYLRIRQAIHLAAATLRAQSTPGSAP
ncbi:MAG: (2Fe-2S)-binding protein, partial [Rhodoferax sp.]|nr:(2Fe-2S)-binding protein [Rhodoferax sp.]